MSSEIQTTLDAHWVTFSQMWMINLGAKIQEILVVVSSNDNCQGKIVSIVANLIPSKK